MSHMKDCCCNLKHSCGNHRLDTTAPKAIQTPTISSVTLTSPPSSAPSSCSDNLRHTLPNVFSARERLEAFERELDLITPLLVHKLPSYRAD